MPRDEFIFCEGRKTNLPRRLWICLAFATWCFADTWVECAEGQNAYYARYGPLRAVILPTVVWEIVLTAILFSTWEIGRRKKLTRKPAFHYLFLALCLLPAGIASIALLRALPFDLAPLVRASWFWPVVFLAGVGPLIWMASHPARASAMVRGILLYSWPVLLLILVQATWQTLRYPSSTYADRPLAPALPASPGKPRVVWIIFDELSQPILFGNREADLAAPNLDSFRQESFYATAASAPADRTLLSIPSLILGQQVTDARPVRPDDLAVKIGSHPGFVSWSSLPNVFETARAQGVNTAAVGWLHPYCRLLYRSLTECYWTDGWMAPGTSDPAAPPSLPAGMWDRAEKEFAAIPLIGHIPGIFAGRYSREKRITALEYLSRRARQVVSDPAIGLAFIHLPVPHPPPIYDRASRRFSTKGRVSYIDNVALTDRVFGELKNAMEDAGLWDRTAVLVSADHGWRSREWRGYPEWTPEDEAASHQDTMGVPFLLKLPGQASGALYRKPFNTLVTARLVKEILAGQVTANEAVVRTIEDSGSR